MIKKEKVFELKIQDDDELSGIDSISLVDEPAIEVNWVAFKKETEHEFHIPDGEDDAYLSKLLSKGQPEQELLDEGWEIDRIESVKENFATAPNDDSYQDNSFYKVRYKYALNQNIKQSAVIPTTRQFCRELINKNYVWRIEEVENEINSFGQSAQFWRGGYNCRHEWYRIFYKRSADIINKAAVNKGKITDGEFPIELGTEWLQPDTVTDKTAANPSPSTIKNLGLSKQGFEVVECKKCGHSWDMKDGGDKPYMCNKCKYDNASEYKMGYDNVLPPYVDQVSGDTISKSLIDGENFQDSYSDYPESVRNNAKAVLKYVEENGWGDCGTEVGKIRANQLAKGEAISLETVKRMYSYLSRHEVDLESSKGYGDGCGKLMYDSWGGKSALSWAQSKINQAEKMSKQYFAQDDEKHIVLGPAMIPDQKIFRKDALGNPYYVYFSSDTIKMIAEKYMRNKYTDNNDTMHDGKAVKDIHVVESWIKDSEHDKSNKYGFENLPIGTWFVSMKVNNPLVWEQVKKGELNGFSVSGYFEEVAQFSKEEMFLYKVAELLKKVKD